MDFLDRHIFNDINKQVQIDEEKFKALDLNKVVTEIYSTAIQRALKDYALEIETKRTHLLEISYTEKQAQEKFNYYTNEIRVRNEKDDCIYRLIKNDLLKNNINTPHEELRAVIIEVLCRHIKYDINTYAKKLYFIEKLPQQIYESNKVHRQFLLFKGLAEKNLNKKSTQTDANRTDIAYYCYYASETKTLELDNIFPSSKSWDEIGLRFSKNPKNIQTVFNAIVYDKVERLKKTRIKNIQFVIENLLKDNEEALKLAKKELNLAELNL